LRTSPEAAEAGVAKIVGTNPNAITDEVQRLFDDSTEYQRMPKPSIPFGTAKPLKELSIFFLAVLMNHFNQRIR